MRLLGARAPQTRALVFAVKGEDLMHLDRANAKFGMHADAPAEWERLGVSAPGRFQNVELYAPRAHGTVSDVTSRPSTEVTTYGWPPVEFIRQGLLRFCFAEDEDASTQVSFIEQRVRVQLRSVGMATRRRARRRGAVPARPDTPPMCSRASSSKSATAARRRRHPAPGL